MLELLIRYFHLFFFALIGAILLCEYVLVSRTMSLKNIQRVAILDALYGISSLGIFILGLILWFGTGKPSSFFSTNMFFHVKLTLFFVLGILSIYPTIFFVKSRKKDDDIIEVPKLVLTIIKIELFIFVLIPLFAVLMVSGYGM